MYVRRYRGGRRRSGLVLGEKKRGNGIKRSVETSGVPRLHRFAEPPCYYTDYIFKCAYPECALSFSLSIFLFPFLFLYEPSRPSLRLPPLRLLFSSLSTPPTFAIRHVLSIFSRLRGFYDTFDASSPATAYFKKPPTRVRIPSSFPGVRRRSGGDSGGES